MPPSKGNHVRVYPGDIIHERYQVLCEIGCGNFSKVYRSIDLLQSKGEEKPVTVAMKILKKEYKRDATYEHRMLQILASKHKSDFVKIPLMLDYFEFKGCPVFIMALHGTSLRNRRLGISKGVVTKQSLQLFAFHILRAIQFIHDECHVVHTDLKPENILIESQQCSERSIGKQWVICDFGSASECVMNNLDSDLISTRPYRAPEVILGNKWHYASDIWSVGCILFEVAIGFRLFEVRDDPSHLHSIHKRISKLPEKFTKRSKHSAKFFNSKGEFIRVPEAVREGQLIMTPMRDFLKDDPLFLDLVQRLLELDPDQRPSAREMLQHPYFNSIREEMQAKEAAAATPKTLGATITRSSTSKSSSSKSATVSATTETPKAVAHVPAQTLDDIGEPILIQSPKDFEGVAHRNNNKPPPPATIRAKPQAVEKLSSTACTTHRTSQSAQQQQSAGATSPTAAAAAAAAALLAKKKSSSDGASQPQQQQQQQRTHQHHRKNSASFYADSESNGLSPVDHLHTPSDDPASSQQSGTPAGLPINATSRHTSSMNNNNNNNNNNLSNTQSRPTNDSSVLAAKRKKRPPGSGAATGTLTYVPLDSSTTTTTTPAKSNGNATEGPTPRPSSRATLSSTQQQAPQHQPPSAQNSTRPTTSSSTTAFGSTISRQKDSNMRGLPERSSGATGRTSATAAEKGARLSGNKPAPASVVAHSKPWEDVSAPASRPATRAIQRDPSDAPAEVLATHKSKLQQPQPQKRSSAKPREMEASSSSTVTSGAGSPASTASSQPYPVTATATASSVLRPPPQHVQRIIQQTQQQRHSPPPQNKPSAGFSPIQYHNNLQLYGTIGAEQLVMGAPYPGPVGPTGGSSSASSPDNAAQNTPVVYAVPRTLSTPRQPVPQGGQSRQPASYTLIPRTSSMVGTSNNNNNNNNNNSSSSGRSGTGPHDTTETEVYDNIHRGSSPSPPSYPEEAVVVRGGLKVRPNQPPQQRSTPTPAASGSTSPIPIPAAVSALQDRSGVTRESLQSIPIQRTATPQRPSQTPHPQQPQHSASSSLSLSTEEPAQRSQQRSGAPDNDNAEASPSSPATLEKTAETIHHPSGGAGQSTHPAATVKRTVIRRSLPSSSDRQGHQGGSSQSKSQHHNNSEDHQQPHQVEDEAEAHDHFFYHHPAQQTSPTEKAPTRGYDYRSGGQHPSVNSPPQQRIITLASSSSSASSQEPSPVKATPTPPPSSSHAGGQAHSHYHPPHHHYHPPQTQATASSYGTNGATGSSSNNALLRLQQQHRQDTLSPISPEPSSTSLHAPGSPYPVMMDAQDVGVMVPPSPIPGRGAFFPLHHPPHSSSSQADYNNTTTTSTTTNNNTNNNTNHHQHSSGTVLRSHTDYLVHGNMGTTTTTTTTMRMPLPHAASKPEMEDSGEIMWHDGPNPHPHHNGSRMASASSPVQHTSFSAPQPPREGEKVYRISKSFTPREGDIYAPPPSRPGTRSQPQSSQSQWGGRGPHYNASSLPVGLRPVPPSGASGSGSGSVGGYVDITPAKQGFSFTTPQPGGGASTRPRGSAQGDNSGDASARLASTVKLQPTSHRGQSEQPPHHLHVPVSGNRVGGGGGIFPQEAWHSSAHSHDTGEFGSDIILSPGVGPSPPSRSSAYKVYSNAGSPSSSTQRLDSFSSPSPPQQPLGKLRGAPNLHGGSGGSSSNGLTWGEGPQGGSTNALGGNNTSSGMENNKPNSSNSSSGNGSALMKRHIARTSPVPIDPNVSYLTSQR